MRRVLKLFAAAAFAAASAAFAALPFAVDGQPLPSLAPMLEKVTPAVVSIQSKTVVRVRSPLAEDPFFRHFFGMGLFPGWLRAQKDACADADAQTNKRQ